MIKKVNNKISRSSILWMRDCRRREDLFNIKSPRVSMVSPEQCLALNKDIYLDLISLKDITIITTNKQDLGSLIMLTKDARCFKQDM